MTDLTRQRIGISDELRVMLRPLATYRALREQDCIATSTWLWIRRPFRWLLMAAAFLSLTTAGRLTVGHMLLAPTIWWTVVVWQMLLVLLFAKIFRSPLSAPRLIDLYFVGQGPWLMLLLVGSGICSSLRTSTIRLSGYPATASWWVRQRSPSATTAC